MKPTRQQYEAMVRKMPTRELEARREPFGFALNLNPTEELIKNVIDAEIERRILMWEAQ